MDPKVKALLDKSEWHEERKKLRQIARDCQLDEQVKWGKLCYSYQSHNVAMIYGLKNNCSLGFLKGALLKDPDNILVKPGDNSQAVRWIKFTDIQQITAMENTLKAYINNAIDVEKSGLKVEFKQKHALVLAQEFQQRLDADQQLKTAFEALTPGRQRAYNLYFSGAKQAKTRIARVEKCTPQILDGKGLHDK